MVRVAAYPPRRSPYRVRPRQRYRAFPRRNQAGTRIHPVNAAALAVTPSHLPSLRALYTTPFYSERYRKTYRQVDLPAPDTCPRLAAIGLTCGNRERDCVQVVRNLVSNALFSRIVRRSTSLRGRRCMGALRTPMRNGAAIAAIVAGLVLCVTPACAAPNDKVFESEGDECGTGHSPLVSYEPSDDANEGDS
jgi:hypothetical protein